MGDELYEHNKECFIFIIVGWCNVLSENLVRITVQMFDLMCKRNFLKGGIMDAVCFYVFKNIAFVVFCYVVHGDYNIFDLRCTNTV